ncbi:bacterial Ig-like domain-containing protein [Intestinimonas sp. UBA1698]|uniref:bacterial Ig-like domain-containing protein n=1 Tax=Intestinimonas sp. UBA1698 TaxID=1946651 RepID=UPI00257BE082|nr:bacterial Ig-like domain-containing protein [Intestinimonas sp. UBA1698]
MFAAPKLTDAGKALYYENMSGAGITFTTIQMGNGTITGSISAMTALVSAVVTIDAAVKNNAEQYADVSGHFSNAELEEGFYWREIGVFAADPDYPDDRSHDILYCYQNAYDTADFIPVASVETVEKNITVPIIVGDASTVSCTLSSSQVLVTGADLDAHNKDANAHNALFEKINKELGKKQDAITAKGILKGGQDAEGNPVVTQATAGVDYQQPTQVLTESDAMALTDTVPFFSGSAGQNRKVTLKKLKEALGVQSASINVTTCAGATVVCTDGETTMNGVGSTKFSLPENTGTWEVTATLNGHTASAVVEVTGAMQYNVDLVITSSVAVTHAPTKTAYNVGETFDPTGLVVTATYADGTTEDVTDGCTFSPTVMAANTTAVTIKYQRAGVTVTTTQAVTVLELSSISVKTAPTKTAYYIGESFNAAGMVIEATMSNGTKKTVTGWTYTPSGALSKTDTAVTISYTENGVTKTCTQAITIRTLSSITVSTAPTKTAYKYGEKFSSAGMVITAKYSDNATRVVTGWTYSPTGALGLSNATITITYAEGGVSKTCTQAITVSNYLSSIAITHAPTKTAYFTGEIFDSAGMVVTATMADGSTKTVTGYTCSPTIMAASTTAVTVSYTEDGVTKTTTTPVTVTSISSTLASNSWATIRAVSDTGTAANYWSVGDAKGITINGKVGNTTFSNLSINVFILGFNHNASREGSNRIHFQIGKIGTTPVALCDAQYNTDQTASGYFNWNTSNINNGGWKSCYKRSTLYGNSGTPTSPVSNSLMAALPSDLRAVMQPVTKYTDNVANGSGNVQSNVNATTDYLFDLAEFEVFGARYYANTYEQNYQLQYDYYKAGNSKVAYKHSAVSTAVWWGLRSPHCSYHYSFMIVWTDGTYGNSTANTSGGLRPGFAA